MRLDDEHVAERWEQAAIHLLSEVAAKVNRPADIGTDDETGVILMFCKARNSDGKATVISTLSDPGELKKILKRTLYEFHRAKIVEPGRPQ